MDETAQRASIAARLDRLHTAAAAANGNDYFGCFVPDAVFIGTDATERWTLAQFKDYAAPYFARGQGWTYEPIERHVVLDGSATVAWFDERLVNAKYGECRGSGVLTLEDGQWLIAHYVLSFPIPNDAAEEVVRVVRERSK